MRHLMTEESCHCFGSYHRRWWPLLMWKSALHCCALKRQAQNGPHLDQTSPAHRGADIVRRTGRCQSTLGKHSQQETAWRSPIGKQWSSFCLGAGSEAQRRTFERGVENDTGAERRLAAVRSGTGVAANAAARADTTGAPPRKAHRPCLAPQMRQNNTACEPHLWRLSFEVRRGRGVRGSSGLAAFGASKERAAPGMGTTLHLHTCSEP